MRSFWIEIPCYLEGSCGAHLPQTSGFCIEWGRQALQPNNKNPHSISLARFTYNRIDWCTFDLSERDCHYEHTILTLYHYVKQGGH